MSEHIQHLTKETFDQACQQATEAKPLLVDFWAEWCGPCKAIAPVLEELAEERADSVTIGKVDVESQVELAQQFNVRAIPTLCVFVAGQMVSHRLGAASKREIEELISAR